MVQNSQPIYSLGEIAYAEDHRLSVIDLYTAFIHLIPGKLASQNLSAGQIIKFTLIQGVPSEISSLAPAESAMAELYKITARKKQTPFFPPLVQAEAEAILNNPGINDPLLTDLEHLAFCTIDGVDTLDLDQALFIEKTASEYIIKYAIADATYYVKPGTALFEEALQRATSFYLPGLMIPMLPRELCVDVISLNENVSRRAIVFEIVVDHQGRHKHTNILRARIKSRGKLSFNEVESFLASPQAPIRNDQALSNSLKYFQQVGQLRLKLAEERNVARYRRTEINVKLGKNGVVFNLLDNVRNQVELYNEQLSLICNTAGALLLAENDEAVKKFIHPIYKIHPPPTEEKLKVFETAIDQLIKIHGLNPASWQWKYKGKQTLSDYLKSLPETGSDNRVAQAIHRQALLINTRSLFSEQPGRHHGVGADVYARFSSPMREIVGIFLHKELMEKIFATSSPDSKQQDQTLREQIIQAANRAKNIQRQLTNEANLLVLDQIFSTDFNLPTKLRPIRKGTVIGLRHDKLYILLDTFSIEIKLYISPLETLWHIPLVIDQDQLALINKENNNAIVSLGDEIKIQVIEKDNTKQRWIFSIKRPI